jgi:uncharacterized protein YcfL
MKNLLLILIPLIAAGCGVKKPIEGRHDPYAQHQIHFASAHLRDSTAVGTPVASRDSENNILYVTVPIRSTTNQQLYIDYRVSFFDRNGQLISESGWFTRTLTPNVPTEIRVNSMTPRAADFRVDFRPAR